MHLLNLVKLNYQKYQQFIVLFILVVLLVFITQVFIPYLTAPKIPLLGFHGIINSKNPEDHVFQDQKIEVMNYPKENFEKFLDYLAGNKFWSISTQELYDYFLIKSKKIPVEHLGEKPIMLSFDDGYKTIHTNLLPILEKIEKQYQKKLKLVLFVNPGTIADYESNASIHLTCKDLREGLKKGFYDIQSHGYAHKNLTKITTKDLVNELSQAQIKIRKCISGVVPENQVANHVAYPYGAYNQEVENYASKYYKSGYLYNSQVLRLGWHKNYYEIPRLTINRQKSPSQLMKIAEKALTLSNQDKNLF